MAASDSKFVDDRNPSIQYMGAWDRKGVDQDFLNTATISKSKGDFATFNFTGALISVYARLNHSNTEQILSISSYQIDGGAISNVTRTTNETTYRVTLFQSNSLPDGNHTLVITNETDDLPLILDFFMVSSGVSSPSATSPPPSQPASSSMSYPASVPNSQGREQLADKAAIIGGVIAGVVILLLGLAAFWWKRRKILSSIQDASIQQTTIPYTHEPHYPRFQVQTNATVDTSVSPFLTHPASPYTSTSKAAQSGDLRLGTSFLDENGSFYALGTMKGLPESASSEPTTTAQSRSEISVHESNSSQRRLAILSQPPPPYHPRTSFQKNHR